MVRELKQRDAYIDRQKSNKTSKKIKKMIAKLDVVIKKGINLKKNREKERMC